MASTLPTAEELGVVQDQPQELPSIPIGVAEQEGDAIASVGQAAVGLGSAIRRENYYEGAVQESYAKSALLTRQAALEDALKDDPDYGSIKQKYNDGMQKIITDTSGMITDPTHANLYQGFAQKEAFALGQTRMDNLVRTKQKSYTLASLDQVTQNNMNTALSAPDEPTAMLALQNSNDAIDGAVKIGAMDPAKAYEVKAKQAEVYAKARLAAQPGSAQVALLTPYLNAMRPAAVNPANAAASATDAQVNPAPPRDFAGVPVGSNGSTESTDRELAASPIPQDGVLPPNSSAPTDSNGAINYVMTKFEGSQLNPNDGGKGPSRYGIVGSDNGLTDAQVKNLTPDQASQIYKKNYWDAIGADDLPPNMRLAAFDTAVNFGVPAAQQMLAQAGNDPQKLLQLRQDKHDSLVASDPAKYGPDAQGWQSRDNMLARDLGGEHPNAPAAKNGSYLDFIPRQDIPQLYNEAHSRAERESVVARSALDIQLNNASAMALNGVVDPNPPTDAQFQAAYGDGAAAAKNNYVQTQMLAHNLKAVQTMAPSQMEDMLKQAEPVAGSPTYEVDVQRRDVLAKAIQSITTQRTQDPVAYGQTYGMIDKSPLNLADPKTLSEQLKARTSAVESMAQSFGTPLQVLSKPEAQFIGQQMDTLPTANKMALLNTMVNSIQNPKVYQAAMEQIRPDSPVTAMAGNYLQLANDATFSHVFSKNEVINPSDVAYNLVAGDNLIHPTKGEKNADGQGKEFPMPPDGSQTTPALRGAFNDMVGDLYRGMPQAADVNYQAFKALYAKNASDAGNYSGAFDSDVAQKSMHQLYGTQPVTQNNGSKALPPWGMQASDFDDAKFKSFEALKTANPDLLKRVMPGDVSLLNTGTQGHYLMQVGNGFLVGSDGQPMVMDLAAPLKVQVSSTPISDAIEPKLLEGQEPTAKIIPRNIPNKRGQ